MEGSSEGLSKFVQVGESRRMFDALPARIPVRGGSCRGVEGIRGPLEPLESFGVLGFCGRHAEALASGLSLFLKVPGAWIPVRDGLCCGVEGSAVLWGLWSPLESLASAVGARKQSIVQGFYVGSKETQRDDRKRHLLLRRGVCSCRMYAGDRI